MSAQTQTAEYKIPQFAFLSKPPPPVQKKRPTAPLPSPPGYPLPPAPTVQRRRSSTFSSIASWAAHVQPGSPAPRSPHRRPSTTSSRRPSITRLARRPSITHGRAPSGSFLHIIDIDGQSAPSAASNATFDLDLTAHGYTSLFVHLPKTPTTPSPFLRAYNAQRTQPVPAPAPVPQSKVPKSAAAAQIPIPPVPQESTKRSGKSGMKRFRSLSILRPKASSSSKSKLPPASPTKPTTTPAPLSKDTLKTQASTRAASIAQRKRSKYAHVRPPPPLANELALMQFADGGALDTHIKRVMDAQAKAAAGNGPAIVGVADVYRDAQGGVWWDAEEEMEYVHLLDGDVEMMGAGEGDMGWEEDFEMFVDEADALFSKPAAATTTIAVTANKENVPVSLSRRTSLTSQDSDLDPKYLLPLPENEDPRLAQPDDRALLFSSPFSSSSSSPTKPGMSLLSLPARPRRRAAHLCKAGLLVDGVAWDVPASPRSPTRSVGLKSMPKPKGKARRRPAPLKLANSNMNMAGVSRRPATPAAGAKSSPQRLRNEFIADSFEPVPLPLSLPALALAPVVQAQTPTSPSSTMHAKASRPSKVRGFFGMARKNMDV